MPNSISQMLALARSGLISRQASLDVVSANLANVNTTGYKANRVNFQETLANAQLGGTRAQATQMTLQSGSLKQTGQPLDLAINGDGFFGVKLANGQTGYSRDGQLQVDGSGQLVSVAGLPIVWQGQIPANRQAVHVNPDGSVMVEQNDIWSQAGQIQINRFANPAGLLDGGQNALLASANSGAATAGTPGSTGFGALVSGALENSNVDLASSMTQMTLLQRGYSLSLKAFEQTDQMLAEAIQLRQ